MEGSATAHNTCSIVQHRMFDHGCADARVRSTSPVPVDGLGPQAQRRTLSRFVERDSRSCAFTCRLHVFKDVGQALNDHARCLDKEDQIRGAFCRSFGRLVASGHWSSTATAAGSLRRVVRY
jgi:hypothetical protein